MNRGDHADRLVLLPRRRPGRIDASQIRVCLCTHACDCPPSGSPEYRERLNQLHGRTGR